MSDSLADRFIRVMALINQIEYKLECPMRHVYGAQKRLAEGILSDAIRRAEDAIQVAEQMHSDHEDAMLAQREKGVSDASDKT